MCVLRKGLTYCIVFAFFCWGGCEDAPKKDGVGKGIVPRSQARKPMQRVAEKEEMVLTTKQELKLVDADFMESPSNRDPFHAILGKPGSSMPRMVEMQRKVILPRFGLDELTLVAVISGGARARAMFRDPTGLGVTVKRGDYVSKSVARVKQILSDKVVMEIEELEEEKRTVADRVIELHTKKKNWNEP
ncbi:MAG: pilus assembly protein PilP [Pseudomonadota bacterium]